MTGPPDPDGNPTWGGLAEEVRYWGNWVLELVRAEIGDLYPPIPDPKAPKTRKPLKSPQLEMAGEGFEKRGQLEFSTETPAGYLTPVAYLWTRTVRCKNLSCGATVPLVRQTWLCKKKSHYVALRMVAPKGAKQVRFEVVETTSEKGLGFDPAGFSTRGNATCPFCGTVADNGYVKSEGRTGRMGTQPIAVACTRPHERGKRYIAAVDLPPDVLPDDEVMRRRIVEVCRRSGLTVPDEPMPKPGTIGFRVQPYGIKTWGELFTPRQMLCLLTFAAAVRQGHQEMLSQEYAPDHATAVVSMLACYVDRGSDHWSSLCAWNPAGEKLQHTFGRQALPMVWDYSEANPWGHSVGDWLAIVENAQNAIWAGTSSGTNPGMVTRGSATALPWPSGTGLEPVLFDSIITDPPYYDNVPYADISDFFYVWLKRTIGHLYPEHFATAGTPKKQEAVAEATRHGGDKAEAVRAYEEMMAQSLAEANRVLKPGGTLGMVYAHKTTLGWSTLVDAFRRAGFVVTEAWPLDTETVGRLRARESAALASSIFLVGRKRSTESGVGSYEDDVQPQLHGIVRERVDALWQMGITGSDLVIAAVGAGLRAFTRFERVEYANGEEVPAESFLTEVEAVVLDSLMGKISGVAGGKVAAVDPSSRFYVLWRYVYKAAEVAAGEAIVFTYGQHVELDGQNGLSNGRAALLEKEKGKYRLRDYTERGEIDSLGLRDEDNPTKPVPLIDVLHRTLWLMERQPRRLHEYLDDAMPNRQQLRLLAAALAGPGLSGKSESDRDRLLATTPDEQSALGKLLANWKALVPETLWRK